MRSRWGVAGLSWDYHWILPGFSLGFQIDLHSVLFSLDQGEGGDPNGIMKLPGRVMSGGVVQAGAVFC